MIKNIFIFACVVCLSLFSFFVLAPFLFPDGCCRTSLCNFISDKTEEFAKSQGGCVCDSFTCSTYCMEMLSQDFAGFDFDCFSICPRSDTMRCGN